MQTLQGAGQNENAQINTKFSQHNAARTCYSKDTKGWLISKFTSGSCIPVVDIGAATGKLAINLLRRFR
jgi:hypothetical protein